MWWMKKKGYDAGQEECLERKDKDGRCASIYYRRPTDDEILQYVFDSTEIKSLNESTLKDITKSIEEKPKSKLLALHEHRMNVLFLPYAKKIIIRWEGYFRNSKEITEYSDLEKYFSSHVSNVCAFAFRATDSYKKKL